MDILDSIIWDMSTDINTALIWDKKKEDYRFLNETELSKKIGQTFTLNCPLDLYGKSIKFDISYTYSIQQIMTKFNKIYSHIQVIDNMDGMTWFAGISELDYPHFVLNVNK